MRRRASAKFTTTTKPYITCGTQDTYITNSKCFHRNIVTMSWTYKLERDPSLNPQQNLNHPVELKTESRFKKDIQIQIGKPKSKETPMISNIRHDDGGNGNPRFHDTIRTTHRFVKHREYKKDIQIKICNHKY